MPVEEGEERNLEHAKMRIFPKSIRVAFFFFFSSSKAKSSPGRRKCEEFGDPR